MGAHYFQMEEVMKAFTGLCVMFIMMFVAPLFAADEPTPADPATAPAAEETAAPVPEAPVSKTPIAEATDCCQERGCLFSVLKERIACRRACRQACKPACEPVKCCEPEPVKCKKVKCKKERKTR